MSFSKKWKQRMYDERKKFIAAYKIARGCKDCHLEGPDEILTFDHVRGEKKFGIGQRWDVSMTKLQAELEKCDVVCFNCHMWRETLRRTQKDTGCPPFESFPKIPRLSRDIIITEKIDGTNAIIWVDEDGDVWAGSKNNWLSIEKDNYGFAAWTATHESEFQAAGPGIYRGEWWGSGIQRDYGLPKGEKRFSLFNVNRWGPTRDVKKYLNDKPACCHVVPVLWQGEFDTGRILGVMDALKAGGSHAAPGFMNPEGIVIFHIASGHLYKKTFFGDSKGKGNESNS